jgi:DNA repair ATPase RecN
MAEIIEAEVKSNIGEVTKDVEKLDKATDKASGGFKGVGNAIKGVGTAIKAAGIGLVVALFAKLMEVFSKNQKVLDFFNTSMTALSIAFNDLFGYIENNVGAVTGFFKDIFENPAERVKELGNAIKQGFIDRFNEALEVLGLVAKSFGQLIKGEFSAAFDTIKEAGKETVDVFTGVDDSYEKVAETVTNYTKKVVEQAKAITETSKAAERAAVEFAKLNAQYLKDAEVQRQIRDDESKSLEERTKANAELGRILDEQRSVEMTNAERF